MRIQNIHMCNNSPLVIFGGLNVLDNLDSSLFAVDKFVEASQSLNIAFF